MRRLYAFPTYFLLAAFVVLAYLRSRMRTGLLFFCTGAATTCVIAFLCLTCLRFWIPCVSLVLVQMTSLVMVLAYKYSLSYSALQRTLLELSVVIRKRRWPTNFYASDEPWHQILTLLRQVFDLERLIILELPAKDVYVKEVCALNCSLDDINERRRDHRRWPFVAATENRGPLRVSENGHQLFKGSPLEEQHFLSPLIFGGEVFGFLAVGVLPLKMTQDFELRLRDFSNELGELLYRRRWVQADRNQAQASVNSLVRIPEVDAYSELIHATHLLERRLDRLENMFQASETAAAIYDIFGRLLMVNERMVSILQSRNVTPSETTTIDLIALLTGWHLDDCRHLLRRIVLDKDHESIPVVMPDDSLFVLSVRPLQLELPQSGAVGTDPHPHLVSGIHCELSDRSNFRTTFSAGISTPPCEQTILGHLDYAEELLDGLPSSNDIDTTSVDPIKGHQTGVALKSTTRVSVVQLIQHIFQQQQKTWQSRGIDFQIDGEIELGRVDVAAFEEVLQAIIEFILHDARDLTTLRILLRTVQNQVIIDLCNEGFGYDTDEIASVRHESFQTNQEVLRRLRSAVQTIEAWGCALHITSELGVGTSCSLKLNREQV